MITQLAHINLFSDRHEEMVDFYTHKLGLKIAFTLDNNEVCHLDGTLNVAR